MCSLPLFSAAGLPAPMITLSRLLKVIPTISGLSPTMESFPETNLRKIGVPIFFAHPAEFPPNSSVPFWWVLCQSIFFCKDVYEVGMARRVLTRLSIGPLFFFSCLHWDLPALCFPGDPLLLLWLVLACTIRLDWIPFN